MPVKLQPWLFKPRQRVQRLESQEGEYVEYVREVGVYLRMRHDRGALFGVCRRPDAYEVQLSSWELATSGFLPVQVW